MSNATNSVGTVLKKGANTVAEIKEINGLDMTAETIDVTTLNSTGGYREFISSFIDPGEVKISGHFYPGDTLGQAALFTAFEGKTSDTYTITFPATLGADWTFTGYVTNFKTSAVVEGVISFECTLKVSGQPNLGTVASTGASAASFVQTDGATSLTAYAITPAFATGTYNYGITYTTQTTCKPKITAVDHTIKCYVDGEYVEDLTSGTAGTAITIGAAATKKVDIIVYESGKRQKVYTFMLARLS